MTIHKKYLKSLESESIYIIREVVAQFKNPVMLYSVGKDSSVMVRLAQKAFYPGKFPFPLMHIDTGFKFPEMYEFRDFFVQSIGARLIVEKSEEIRNRVINPSLLGNDRCCQILKTRALLSALAKHGFDAAFGGARRDEEKSRAKERIFSVRDTFGQWDPKNQRPEIWDIYNGRINKGESVRVFPLSNWTEEDVWQYIKNEDIPVVPLYFSKKRKIIDRQGLLIPVDDQKSCDQVNDGQENILEKHCRFRSLGCIPCTGAIESEAADFDDIIREVIEAKRSERENRIIDLTSESSMEEKKREGYF